MGSFLLLIWCFYLVLLKSTQYVLHNPAFKYTHLKIFSPEGKMYPCHCNASCTDVTFQSYAAPEKMFGLICDLKWESRICVHALASMRQSSKNNEKQFEVLLQCLCQDSFRSILSTFRGSLNILARWIELHLRREWMEIKLLYKAWVALPSTWQSAKCCISKLYNVSQMWGKVKVGVKEKKRGVKPVR